MKQKTFKQIMSPVRNSITARLNKPYSDTLKKLTRYKAEIVVLPRELKK